jgi:hypothetical protein
MSGRLGPAAAATQGASPAGVALAAAVASPLAGEPTSSATPRKKKIEFGP